MNIPEMMSPIEIITTNTAMEINRAVEGEIMNAVMKVGVFVDKERLMQAITDSRSFYREGYKEGYEDGQRDAVKHGHWIGKQLDNYRKYQVTCSKCGWVGIEDYDSYNDPSDFNFCPYCGTDMRGDD